MDVTVTNNSDKDVSGRFNSAEFEFPKGKTVTVPDVAARHILGYGVSDKEGVVVRLGWTNTNGDIPAALRRLARFRFDPPENRPRNVPPEAAQRVPLNASKEDAGGKLLLAE